ncbi:hypothetical protein ACFVYA_36190, partial [Amycolatopsis sp. NPDC058278]|uniref:hypothetical protein n=1 Tax=Amycolatopsis sp. NPDC058278 TaxID=3346417 RepID=UPI0036DA602B
MRRQDQLWFADLGSLPGQQVQVRKPAELSSMQRPVAWFLNWIVPSAHFVTYQLWFAELGSLPGQQVQVRKPAELSS